MSDLRNLAWGRKELARILRFNVDEADELFEGTENNPWETIDAMLNQAQRAIVNEVRVYINPRSFAVVHSGTWPASTPTYRLPSTIHASNVLRIADVTSGQPGLLLNVNMDSYGLYWQDYRTLAWGNGSEPGWDISLQLTALATPNTLSAPSHEPLLIPYDHRDLWVWEAACLSRVVADDEAPGEWSKLRDRYKDTLQTHIAQGAPWGPGKPAIAQTDYYVLTIQ